MSKMIGYERDCERGESTFVFSQPFHAGMIVNRLNEQNIESHIEWEDDGDVGMKNGGWSSGKDFQNAGGSSWGGCLYTIDFACHGHPFRVYLYQSEGISPSQKVSVKCTEESEKEFLQLMGWDMNNIQKAQP